MYHIDNVSKECVNRLRPHSVSRHLRIVPRHLRIVPHCTDCGIWYKV